MAEQTTAELAAELRRVARGIQTGDCRSGWGMLLDAAETIERLGAERDELIGALHAIADYTDGHGGWTETAHDAGVVSGLVHEMARGALAKLDGAPDG
jgi:hypothetical protein